ncbi:MAG: hypothetical protein NWF05_07870 [Candidatus Bathyarchaeota archaeon]|nr:hypothetical protein [Candidatus Bathyarchaeota archaeon]
MSGKRKVSGFVMISVLFVGLCFAAFPQLSQSSLVKASSILPDSNAEYADGTIVSTSSFLNVWYDWINVSDTQIINYALYTPTDYDYPVPIANLLGQHLHLADGSEVFVASALDGMEVYRDVNGDGIPQANFTSGESEILYFMYSNMSDGYNMAPIQKFTQNDTVHYQWSLTYENVYTYLQNATSHLGVAVRVKLDHFTLSYDFSVNGNVSNLKTNFDIGKTKDIQTFDAATQSYVNSTEFSFDGLSLSLLYATATYASKPYTTSVNGEPYNSTTTQDLAVEAEAAQVTVDGAKAYDFMFGGEYTLYTEEGSQTQAAQIETYQAKAEAAAIDSLPIKLYGPTVKGISFFTKQLNLTDLFGGSWPNVNTSYNASSLVYRICFPVWDGNQIVHDPVYVGYLGSATIPEFPAAAIAVGLLAATAAVLTTTKAQGWKAAKKTGQLLQGGF